MWGAVFSLFGGAFKDWLKSRADLEQKKAIAKIENVSKGIPGYSDDYLIFIWSYPFIAGFIPVLQDSAAAGLAAFESYPDWYVGGFITISFSVFGIDKLFKWKG